MGGILGMTAMFGVVVMADPAGGIVLLPLSEAALGRLESPLSVKPPASGELV